MADLRFDELASALPAGSIVADADNDDVLISLKAVTGEATLFLANPKVTEAVSKLLDGCVKAQTAYNADPANARDIRSFPAPTTGAPTADENGIYGSNFTYTVIARYPINRGEAGAVEI